MWATAAQTRAQILELAEFSARHSDETIELLPLDAVGNGPLDPNVSHRTQQEWAAYRAELEAETRTGC